MHDQLLHNAHNRLPIAHPQWWARELRCCQPEVVIPSSQASQGGSNRGSAPLFRQRITIDFIVSKAVHSRGSHGLTQLCVMGCLLWVQSVTFLKFCLRLFGDLCVKWYTRINGPDILIGQLQFIPIPFSIFHKSFSPKCSQQTSHSSALRVRYGAYFEKTKHY